MSEKKLWKLILHHQAAACSEMRACGGPDADEYYDKLAALIASEGALIVFYGAQVKRIAELEAWKEAASEKLADAYAWSTKRIAELVAARMEPLDDPVKEDQDE